MSDHPQLRETEKVVSHVMKTVAKHENIGKEEFEAILREVMQQVQKNTAIEPDRIMETTPKVLEDMPREYGQLSQEERSWEAMIAYLYTKYLKELGRLK